MMGTDIRCTKRCRRDPARSAPDCDYLSSDHNHGYTVTIGRTHADGTVRLAREIPCGSPAWKKRYHRRNSAESRNSVMERLGLKLMPVHGQSRAHVTVLHGDFVAKQRKLVRLGREATTRGWLCLFGGASGGIMLGCLKLVQRPVSAPRFTPSVHRFASSSPSAAQIGSQNSSRLRSTQPTDRRPLHLGRHCSLITSFIPWHT